MKRTGEDPEDATVEVDESKKSLGPETPTSTKPVLSLTSSQTDLKAPKPNEYLNGSSEDDDVDSHIDELQSAATNESTKL